MTEAVHASSLSKTRVVVSNGGVVNARVETKEDVVDGGTCELSSDEHFFVGDLGKHFMGMRSGIWG